MTENGSRILAESAGGRTTYGWDAANRLKSASLPDGRALTFSLTDCGMKFARPNTTERTLWDGDDVLAWLGTENASPEMLFARGQNLARGVGVGRSFQSFRISGTPTTVSLGGAVTASWDVPQGRSPFDWITLYKVGQEYHDYGDWEYTNGARSGNASLSVSGTVTGLYEARYMLEDHYIGVAGGDTVAVGGGAGVYAVTARPWVVNITDSVVVTWSAPQGRSSTDWVGLFKVGEADNHNYVSRAYTNGTVTGKASLSGPTDSGQYEVRYLRADSFTDLATTSNQIEIGTVNRQYQLDGQGSVEAMTQKLWGGYNSQQNQYWTDAWGNSNSPSDSGNPYVYLGEHGYWYEPELGMYYVRARWLNPTNGQWLSVDPIETEMRYSYVGNQPTVAIDPSGTQAVLSAAATITSNAWNWTRQESFTWLFNRLRRPVWDQTPQEEIDRAIIASRFPGIAQEATAAKVFSTRAQRELPWWAGDAGQVLSGLGDVWNQTVTMLLGLGEVPWRFLAEGGESIANRILSFFGASPIGQATQRALEGSSAARTLGSLLPPRNPLSPEFGSWSGGFLWGILETAVQVIAGTPGDILKLIGYLASPKKNIWKDLVEYVEKAWGDLVRSLEGLYRLKAYDRGKILGILVASAVLLLLAGKGIVAGAKAIGKIAGKGVVAGTKAVGEVASKGLGTARESLSAAVTKVDKALKDAKHTLGLVLEFRAKEITKEPIEAIIRRAYQEGNSKSHKAGMIPQTLVRAFRGESASRPPSDVFERGLSPKGDDPDLMKHLNKNPNSGFIAASEQFDIAVQFAGKNAWVYEIVTQRGIPTVNRFGERHPHPYQYEISLQGWVSPAEIRGAWVKRQGKLTGEFIPNPRFRSTQ